MLYHANTGKHRNLEEVSQFYTEQNLEQGILSEVNRDIA